MRILTLNANLRGVGTYQRCFYFSRELARQGHHVTLCTVSRRSRWRARICYKTDWVGDAERPSGDGPWVRLIEGAALGYRWLPGWGSAPLDIARRFGEILVGEYDVVYGFEYQPNVSWPVYLTRHVRGYRFLSDWCDWYAGHSNRLRGWKLAHRVDAFFEERIRFLAHRVTVISTTLAQRALALGIPGERVVKLDQGADTEYLRPMEAEAARARVGLPAGRRLVVAVRDGDMRRLLRVHARVVEQAPDVLLVVVGSAPASLRSAAAELGLDRQVLWAGRVSDEDYPVYLAAADVCLLPLEDGINDRARFPGKLLDYLAVGRPVVTNDVGDVGDALRDQPVGLLASGETEAELAAAVLELVEDRERSRRLGEAARRLMLESWDWRLRGPQIAALVNG